MIILECVVRLTKITKIAVRNEKINKLTANAE